MILSSTLCGGSLPNALEQRYDQGRRGQCTKYGQEPNQCHRILNFTGIVPNVVFLTGIDVREGGRVDVYYGMADAAIGVARLDSPVQLDEP